MGHEAGYVAYVTYGSIANLRNVEIVTDASKSALLTAFSATTNASDVSVVARGGGYGILVQDGSIHEITSLLIKAVSMPKGITPLSACRIIIF